MRLSSVDTLRDELGFDNMSDINGAIKLALDAAEGIIASTLGTTLGRKTITDTFFAKTPGHQSGRLNLTEFRLSAGFLLGIPTISGERVFPENISFDLERGVAKDWTTLYAENFVTFSYSAGFEEETIGDPAVGTGQYKLDQVPLWLQQASNLKGLQLIAKHPAVTEAGVVLDTTLLDLQYANLINAHIRYAPSALLPL